LRILGSRTDGFHELRSVFHTVSLKDTLDLGISAGSRGLSITVSGEDAPADESNLAWRAASTWLEASGASFDIDISLVKRIPCSAGLGGGSSDAAAVLRALNSIGGEMEVDLHTLAMTLGSDVPFFLSGGAALVEGRGELVSKICCPPFWAVVLSPAISISTPWAYSLWDSSGSSLTKTGPGNHCSASVTAWHEDKPFPIDLRNDFLPLLLESLPVMADLAGILEGSCENWGLSGSGPSVFALYRTEEEAIRFAENPPCGVRAFVCSSTSCDGA
jgi:4-diphosphocytidyl-2-C-methyl-D-erythritol kinase